MTLPDKTIRLKEVSKFYGEVLGINRVSLSIDPGITSLVGPNGAGKTTLMNLITGLLQPTHGEITVLGLHTDQPEALFRHIGYCSQFDAFPRGFTGHELVYSLLLLHGFRSREADSRALRALETVGLTDAAHRRLDAYSKGMRQRARLAQALAHDPAVLILDEPLNGLDPMARAETIDLFKMLARSGRHLVISSHILHEVDLISDRVVLIDNGYVVAEGDVHGMRTEMEDHPIQILIRCDQPALVASRGFEQDHVVEVKIHDDGRGLFVRTRDADRFYTLLQNLVIDCGLEVESVLPADESVSSIYEYLIGKNGGRS
jgi:ABC-2 type transport system ATP-binding protein